MTTASETVFDTLENLFGERVDHLPHERGGEGGDDQHDDDLGNEGQRHLLHLRERLEQGDDDADGHRRRDSRASRQQYRPDRRLDDIERIGFAHRQVMTTPAPSVISLPLSSMATAPPSMMRTPDTLPLMLPSAEVRVRPITLSACDSEKAVSSESSLAFARTCCSTAEKLASCDTCSVGSIGSVGSWYCS